MTNSNSYQDWYQSMNQIGFKNMESFSVFYNRVFEWQTHFYKAPLRAVERVGELYCTANFSGNSPLKLQDLFLAFQAFHLKELITLYQSRQFKQTSLEVNDILPVVKRIQKDYLENAFLPFPLKVMLYLRYPYFNSDKNVNSIKSGFESNAFPEKGDPIKKKRRE